MDQTQLRILTAARELLMAEGGFARFTIDAVAQQAGVARMTVYHHFGSKAGLLEGLCDFQAARGGIEQLAGAFCRPVPLDALSEFIAVLCRFYASDRPMIRRLVGLANLDPDFEQVLRGRYDRRREGLRVLIRRVADTYGRPVPESFEEMIDVLNVLTSFETFDALAGSDRTTEEVIPMVRQLVRATLGLTGECPGKKE
jgi:AcrR family transcriptional regulator